MKKERLGIDSAARFLGVSKAVLNDLIKAHRIRSSFSDGVVIELGELQTFLAAMKVPSERLPRIEEKYFEML